MWLIALAGCSAEAVGGYEPAVPDAPDLRLEVIYAAALAGGQVEIGGLDGAADPGASVQIADRAVNADARGRFKTQVSGVAGDTVDVGGFAFRVRDVESARAAVVHPALGGAGDGPNDLLFLDDDRALLVRSGDNAISIFDPATGVAAGHGIRMPEGANPWFVARIDAHRVAVTAQRRHVVYIIDLDTDQVVATLEPPIVSLGRTFVLSAPRDVDGDGAMDASITQLKPRAPQAVVVVGRRLIAAFSGFIDVGLFVPGVVLSWSLDDLAAPPLSRVVSALDPQELTVVGDDRVLVTMSGAVVQDSAGQVSTSSGAVELLDVATLEVEHSWSLDLFAPTTAMIAAGALWVGSLANGRVRALDDSGVALVDFKLNDETVDSIFRLVSLPGGLIGAGSNNTDMLHVIDPVTRTLAPLPFGGPIAVGPGRPLPDGLQILARRPGRAGVDFVGPDVLAMMRASRIIPLELRKVLGP